jgi:pimeloyl-ACP methyl ester carboxylesterase
MKSLPINIIISLTLLLSCKGYGEPAAPGETLSHQLPDGRNIAYMEYGPTEGTPLLYFHGFPGSHEDIHLFDGASLAEQLNVRLITVNRPGYVNSDHMPKRSLLDFPEDVASLAKHLGLEKFSILAYSGGGPFALACAFAIPERLHHIGIVSGMGPADAPEAKKGKSMFIPKAPKMILKGMKKMMEKKPEKFRANMKKGFAEVDQKIYEIPLVEQSLLYTMEVALSQGIDGAREDAKIYKKEWRFSLSEIDHPILMWHGGEDENVKVETARYVSENLPNCTPVFMEQEGHLSLIYTHAEEIIKTLLKQE